MIEISPGILLWNRDECGYTPTSPSNAIDERELFEWIAHHSTGSNLGVPDPFAWWRSIRDYHVNTLGYSDVAYIHAVARDSDPNRAHVLTGRGLGRAGGHTLNHNRTGTAVVLLGDGRYPDQLTPGILRAFAAMSYLHSLTPHTRPRVMTDHGTINPGTTACCGGALRGQVMYGFPGGSGAPLPPASPPTWEPKPVGVDWTPILALIAKAKATVLRRGAIGLFVGIAQRRLADLGFNESGMVDPVAARASFGARTERQVRLFQKARLLRVDGIIGRQTWNALYQA